MEKKIFIFGVTGNIGTQTCAVCQQLGLTIVGATYHHNELLAKQLGKKYQIEQMFCTKNITTVEQYKKILTDLKIDLVVNAISSIDGLNATLATIEAKIDLALANKESIVICGKQIVKLVKEKRIKLLPIDSEHASLWALEKIIGKKHIEQYIITGSGGKFFGYDRKQLRSITYQEATIHPNWQMGNKITIDSNTLINKCLEVIEAYWYYQTKQIELWRQRSSLVHALVKTRQNEYWGVVFQPSMFIPIQWALTDFPLNEIKKYCFKLEKKDLQKYQLEKKALKHSIAYKLAKRVIKRPHDLLLPMTINCANVVAIELFQQKKLSFDQIPKFIVRWTKKIKKFISPINDQPDFNELMQKVTNIIRLNS